MSPPGSSSTDMQFSHHLNLLQQPFHKIYDGIIFIKQGVVNKHILNTWMHILWRNIYIYIYIYIYIENTTCNILLFKWNIAHSSSCVIYTTIANLHTDIHGCIPQTASFEYAAKMDKRNRQCTSEKYIHVYICCNVYRPAYSINWQVVWTHFTVLYINLKRYVPCIIKSKETNKYFCFNSFNV